jgi:hypothetical protein
MRHTATARAPATACGKVMAGREHTAYPTLYARWTRGEWAHRRRGKTDTNALGCGQMTTPLP